MRDIYELIDLIEKWADNKGIYKSANPLTQSLKVIEEVGELIKELNHLDKDLIKDKDLSNNTNIEDAIGDTLITLINFCKLTNLNLNKCLDEAYKQIENRNGHILNGRFIKDDKK